MIVLDRPNPIGGESVEGNLVDPDYSSFVGLYPIPNRHGMTVGELAAYFNEEFHIRCELEVVSMEGWEQGFIPHGNGASLDSAFAEHDITRYDAVVPWYLFGGRDQSFRRARDDAAF